MTKKEIEYSYILETVENEYDDIVDVLFCDDIHDLIKSAHGRRPPDGHYFNTAIVRDELEDDLVVRRLWYYFGHQTGEGMSDDGKFYFRDSGDNPRILVPEKMREQILKAVRKSIS